MKRFLFVLFFAVSAHAWVYVPVPHVYNGFYGGYPYGFGYGQLFFGQPPPGPVPYYGFNFWPYFGGLPRFATFGVLAYSPETDTVGYSWGNDSIEMAERNALSNCNRGDCRSIVWVQGGCAALSINPAAGTYGWAYSWSFGGAKYWARKACRANGGGTGCFVRGWVCSN